MKHNGEQLKHLKSEVNAPKSALLSLLRKVETISRPQAIKLERIIARLEAWQHT